MVKRDHAVVIGASMAGLLSAAVLGDHFARVTILERDELPKGTENRRGVPQGRHPHALLARGRQIIEELFPGIVDELRRGGAPMVENLDEFHFEILGHLVCDERRVPADSDLTALQPSRPYLESAVRARLRRRENIEIREGFAVAAPVVSADRSRVVGVHGAAASGGSEEEIAADLVVDASGRAGRAAAWLADWNYPAVPLEEVKVRVSYVSQHLRLRPDSALKKMYIVGMRPDRPVGMAVFANENETWIFTVISMGDAGSGVDRQAMLDAVQGIAPPELHSGLSAAEVLSEPTAFAYPASRRHHYEKLPTFPEGFLVIGDAICSFNPIYGQGMTIAAMEADALRSSLTGPDEGLWRRYFKAAAPPVDTAWMLSTGTDLAMPGVAGELTAQMKLGNKWVDHVLRAAETDAEVARRFLRVTSMLDKPTALFRPAVAARVVRPRHPRTTAPAMERSAG